jgi:hypothetical protein
VVRARVRREEQAFGGLIALPSFLFATSRIVSGYVGGLPVHPRDVVGRGLELAQDRQAQR